MYCVSITQCWLCSRVVTDGFVISSEVMRSEKQSKQVCLQHGINKFPNDQTETGFNWKYSKLIIGLRSQKLTLFLKDY